MNPLKYLSVFVASLALAACSPNVPSGASIVEIENAFIVAPPAGRDVTGAGMDVKLQGPDRKLIRASSDIARKIEFHTMAMTDGQMQMRQVDGFVVTESTPLKLERGGNHLMVFGLKTPLVEGETVDILLTFSDGKGGELDILTTAEVVSPAG